MTTTNISDSMFKPVYPKVASVTLAIQDSFEYCIPDGETEDTMRKKCETVDNWRDAVSALVFTSAVDFCEVTGLTVECSAISLGGNTSISGCASPDVHLKTEDGKTVVTSNLRITVKDGPCVLTATSRIASRNTATPMSSLIRAISSIADECE